MVLPVKSGLDHLAKLFFFFVFFYNLSDYLTNSVSCPVILSCSDAAALPYQQHFKYNVAITGIIL